MQRSRLARGAARAVAVLLLILAGNARAADLRVGVAALSTSADPHFYNLAANLTLSRHLIDRLTERTPDSKLQPGLALSWTPVSDTVWEFRLRPGVTWSDGVPFTADDVTFTVERARSVPGSPSSFAGFLRAIQRVEVVVDPLTVRFHTAAPAPKVPIDLAQVECGADRITLDIATGEDQRTTVAVSGAAFSVRHDETPQGALHDTMVHGRPGPE